MTMAHYCSPGDYCSHLPFPDFRRARIVKRLGGHSLEGQGIPEPDKPGLSGGREFHGQKRFLQCQDVT
jgi:hypothetical protein